MSRLSLPLLHPVCVYDSTSFKTKENKKAQLKSQNIKLKIFLYVL